MSLSGNSTDLQAILVAVNSLPDSGEDIELQDKTITPSEVQRDIIADNGYNGLRKVTVNAISGSYVGSEISRNTADDLIESGNTISVPSGYYADDVSKSVSLGSAGTPVAVKGTVTNNSVLITPTVTNTTGYIAGGVKTGSDISVSASELVSGDKRLSSGTILQQNIDVTNYESVSIDPIESSAIDNSIISGTVYQEDTNDYAWRSTVNIPAGYHTAQTLTKDFSEIFPAPDTEGTAATVRSGYQLYDHSGKLITGTMTEKTAATYTPSVNDQIISGSQYLAGAQTIKGDSNLIAANIASGVSLFGITGSHAGQKTEQSKTLTLGASAPSTVSPDSGKVLSSVPVSIDSTVIKAENIKDGVTILGIEGTHVGGFSPSGNKAITASTSTQSEIDVTNYATVSVAPTPSETKSVTVNGDVTPSSGKLLSKVTVNVPTGTARSSSDLTSSGATVTVPAGLYSSQATKTISSGSATTPATTKQQSKPLISISDAGLITASVAATSVDVTPTVSAGYVSAGTAGTITMSANSNTKQLTTQAAKTVTPNSSSQTAVASGVYTTGAVTVAAVPTETKTVVANGTITPSSGKYLSSVTVNVPLGANVKWYGTRNWNAANLGIYAMVQNETWTNVQGITGISVGDIIMLEVTVSDSNPTNQVCALLIKVNSIDDSGAAVGDSFGCIKIGYAASPIFSTTSYDGSVS